MNSVARNDDDFFKGTGIMNRWWGILLGLCIMPAFALQNELAIYAGAPTQVPARIMLLIDTSGSMNYSLDGRCRSNCPETRMDVLRRALIEFIGFEEPDSATRWPDSFEVGLARFTTGGDGISEINSAVIKAEVRRLDFVYPGGETTHREFLHNIVISESENGIAGIEPQGSTPLMTSYLETVEYLTGGSAISGWAACDSTGRAAVCNVSSVWQGGVLGDYRQGMSTSLICNVNNNHLVVLTDGLSTEESADNPVYNNTITIGQRINQIVSGDDSATAYHATCREDGETGNDEVDNNFSWGCVNPLAEWLADKDDNGEVQGIKTHTIAYSLGEYSEGEDPSCTIPREIDNNSTAPDFLCNWALKGGGKSFAANDETELQNAFQSISEDALLRESFTAAVPGVGVNQSNRFTYLDDIYYSVFKPSDSSFWYGNLKKYMLETLDSGLAIVGQGDIPIDGDANGFVDPDVQSFWTAGTVVDGDNVLLGGAASKIPAVDTRRLFTYLDGTETQITDDSVSDVVNEMLPEGAGEAASESQEITDLRVRYSAVLDWLRGTDTGGVEWDRLTGEENKTHRQLYGAPIHSSPVVVNYTSTRVNDDGERVTITDSAEQSNLVFVSTNDGKLYGVDAQTGTEKLAFIPGEFLQPAADDSAPYIADLYDAAREGLTGPVLFGLDATWSVWRQDVNRDGNITSGDGGGDWVYLYGGMRRGGRNYYGLNMTAANDSPADMDQLFVLKGGESGSEFENMGQTWSEPVLGMIKYQGKSVVVMIVGGGYDPIYDAIDSDTGAPIRLQGTPTTGAQLYIVAAHSRGTNDIQAGDVLWWASLSLNSMPGNHQRIAELEDSIPSTVKVLDKDGDGYLDHIYVGDLGGRIHRIDINIDNTEDGPLATSSVVAQLGMRGNGTASAPADDRRFYFPPSIALMKDNLGRKYVSLAIGSGLLTSPRDTSVNEKFYFIRDYAAFGTTVSAADNPPYEYVLGREAEKLLGSPLIVGGQVYFSTYYWGDNAVVASDANQCRAQYGRAALYRYAPNTNQTVNLKYAQPQTLAGSLATIMREIEEVTNEEGELIQPSGSDFIGIGGTSAFDLPDVDLGNIRKTRWKQCPETGVCN